MFALQGQLDRWNSSAVRPSETGCDVVSSRPQCRAISINSSIDLSRLPKHISMNKSTPVLALMPRIDSMITTGFSLAAHAVSARIVAARASSQS